MTITGVPAGTYAVSVNGGSAASVSAQAVKPTVVSLSIGADKTCAIQIGSGCNGSVSGAGGMSGEGGSTGAGGSAGSGGTTGGSDGSGGAGGASGRGGAGGSGRGGDGGANGDSSGASGAAGSDGDGTSGGAKGSGGGVEPGASGGSGSGMGDTSGVGAKSSSGGCSCSAMDDSGRRGAWLPLLLGLLAGSGVLRKPRGRTRVGLGTKRGSMTEVPSASSPKARTRPGERARRNASGP